MSPAIPDLWPPDFGTSSQPSPASILRQQAHLLGQRTRNVVVGEIESKSEGRGRFLHQFVLAAPLLDFRQPLLHIRHGVEVYPVELAVYDDSGAHVVNISAVNSEQFMSALKSHLAAERIVRLVRSLVDQCRDPDDRPEDAGA